VKDIKKEVKRIYKRRWVIEFIILHSFIKLPENVNILSYNKKYTKISEFERKSLTIYNALNF